MDPTPPGVPPPVADRLRRSASVRSGRPLREMSDPDGTAAVLARTAIPPVTDPAVLRTLTDVLAGRSAELPPATARSLAAALGLPPDALDPATHFDRAEEMLLRGYLDDRGVVDVRSCRGGRGRTALLDLLGLVDRAAAGS